MNLVLVAELGSFVPVQGTKPEKIGLTRAAAFREIASHGKRGGQVIVGCRLAGTSVVWGLLAASSFLCTVDMSNRSSRLSFQHASIMSQIWFGSHRPSSGRAGRLPLTTWK